MTTETRTQVERQSAYNKRRKDRGDRLAQVWMRPDVWELWQRLHAQHGGTEATLQAALRKLADS